MTPDAVSPGPPTPPAPPAIFYPESDGQPMSDNTRQARWIVILFGNLSALFRGQAVFVAADLLWYPVEGQNRVRQAPDVMVVWGRPPGDRGSYRQWEEADVPVTVAFEILSPGNSDREMADKLAFYEEHGVEEYYLYDPDRNRLEVYRRQRSAFRRVHQPHGFVSPRLGISFDLSGPELIVRHPDGRPFLTFEQVVAERELAEGRALLAQRTATRLAELGRKARRGTASPDELAELDRLEAELLPPEV